MDLEDLDDSNILDDKRSPIPIDPEVEWWGRSESVPYNRDHLMMIDRRSAFNWRRPGSRRSYIIPFYRIGDGVNYLSNNWVRPSRVRLSSMIPYRGF